MSRIIFLIKFVFIVLFAQAQQDLGASKIEFNNSDIKLDGELKESIWSQLVPEGGFVNFIPNNGELASNKTEVKMFHNGKNLYISAVYHDTSSRVQLGSLKRDDISNSGADSDAFAIIIDTYNQQQSGYFFIANMGGALIDALVARQGNGFSVNTNWNTTWNARTSVKGNMKIFEIEIPLKALSFEAGTSEWGVMFHTRNIKLNEWTTSTQIDRNYRQFDLRFAKIFTVENLADNKTSRFAVTPSITTNYSENLDNNTDDTMVKPSLDIQFNVSSSLKLDATINPDFSQIDVDRQVTNLSRFSVFFPERRNFFLENSDLFNSLGVNGVNPFYSRRIGANSEISFGLKLSGNIAEKTRLGVLNVATKAENDKPAQNYVALVVQQQLSKSFAATGFLINRQETDGFSFNDNYNRVTGFNLNYQSKNNRWTGVANIANSASSNISGKNNFYNMAVWYNKVNISGNVGIRKVEKNYITDVGFVPRLYNYDAILKRRIREGYTQAIGHIGLTKFYKKSKIIDNYRYLNLTNNTFWDEQGKLAQSVITLNNNVVFKNQSLVYGGVRIEYVNLKYAFDPLNKGNAIITDQYNFMDAGVGYASADNKKIQYGANVRYGGYYNGSKSLIGLNAQYRLLPLARLQFQYERNGIDLKELGKDTFHLARFIGEIFFTNRLNWTTYVQYNTQFDNFNINSRLQWEYKPLSYIYLVVSDNYNQDLIRKNWGVAFKMNYRLDF